MEIEYYNKIDFFNLKSSDGLTIIGNFRTLPQIADNACGCACVRMLLDHYKKPDIPEEELLKLLKAEPFPVGIRLINIVDYLKSRGFSVLSAYDLKDESGYSFKSYDAFKNFVIKCLKNNDPVMVENVDYGGHWKIIIGFHERKDIDGDMLIFADPYSIGDFENNGFAFCGASRFFAMWFDAHCLLPEERTQPFLVLNK